jgi:hypothetical protein
MGTRVKVFESTGLAPNGRLYAGDLNAIQDQYADQANFNQEVDAAAFGIGEAAIKLVRYGPGEARLSGLLRIDGIFRGLGGLIAGAFTTAQRNALATGAGLTPYGVIILNTTTNQYEWNKGNDTTRNWQPLGFVPANGVTISDPDIAAGAGIQISKLAGFPNDASKALMGDGTWAAPSTLPTLVGNSYTPVISDNNKIVEINNVGAVTLTVPPNSGVAFPIGATISVAQLGAGQITIAPGAGVTLRAYNGNLRLAGQYAVASIIKRGTDDWWAAGNLVP